MKKIGVYVFLLIVILICVSFVYASDFQNGFYQEYLVRGQDNIAISIENLNSQTLGLIDNNLLGLKNSGEIKDYAKDNENLIISFNDNIERRIRMTNLGIEIIQRPTSYIVEFNSLPLIESSSGEFTTQSTVDKKEQLESEHENALVDINNKLSGSESLASLGFIAKIGHFFRSLFGSITGNVVADNLQITPKAEFYNVVNGVVLELNEEQLEIVKSSSYVKNVYPNLKVYSNLIYSIPLINADDVWRLNDNSGNSLTGKNVTIGIIDTGIDYTHPDLGGCFGESCKVVGGYDFVNGDTNPMDDQGHGTHCAGIVAGNGVLKGVAPDAQLYAYKVLDSGGSGYVDGIIAAIESCVDINGDGDFSDHLDVISLSLGGSGDPDDPMSMAIDRAVNAGVVAVIAAGNSGGYATIGSPGTSRNAITVGATYNRDYEGEYWDDNPRVDQITSFSSRGPVEWAGGILIKPDVVAPGALICSARYDSIFPEGEHEFYKPCIDEKHVLLAGTSMATPMVAGAAALLKQAYPDLSAHEIKSLLKINAVNLINPNTSKSYYELSQGAGRIDILKSVNSEITTGDLDFEIVKLTALRQLTIKNLEDKAINLKVSVEKARDYFGNEYSNLISMPSTISLNPKETKTISVNLNLPSDLKGTFIGRIKLNSGINNYSLLYSFSRVSNLTLSVNNHYPNFLIFSNNSSQRVRQISQGWDFSGEKTSLWLEPGKYFVYAINDFVITDPNYAQYYPETDEYVLNKEINVLFDSNIYENFALEDARIYTVKAKDKSNADLELIQWNKDISFIDLANEKVLSVGYINGIASNGDKKIHISNKPASMSYDNDLAFYYYGFKK